MVLVVVFPINVVVSIALIHHTPLGLLGSPLALSVTYWLSFGLLALYTTFSPTHRKNRTWGGIDIKAVLDLNSCVIFLKLALPGILMVGTEWYVLPNDTIIKDGVEQHVGPHSKLLHLQLVVWVSCRSLLNLSL